MSFFTTSGHFGTVRRWLYVTEVDFVLDSDCDYSEELSSDVGTGLQELEILVHIFLCT